MAHRLQQERRALPAFSRAGCRIKGDIGEKMEIYTYKWGKIE